MMIGRDIALATSKYFSNRLARVEKLVLNWRERKCLWIEVLGVLGGSHETVDQCQIIVHDDEQGFETG